jgi:hypothetical protein
MNLPRKQSNTTDTILEPTQLHTELVLIIQILACKTGNNLHQRTLDFRLLRYDLVTKKIEKLLKHVSVVEGILDT